MLSPLFFVNYLLASPVTLKSAIFLVYDRLNYELAIIVALKGIAFSSFLVYLIIY